MPLHLRGVVIERARCTNQIQRHIGQRQILLQHRRVATPLAQPMAQNQMIIGQLQNCLEQSHYMCPTSSGMS